MSLNSGDIITTLSQNKEEEVGSKNDFVLFPEIPDPPPGFDPEADPLFKDNEPHSDAIVAKKRGLLAKKQFTPRARVFIIGEDGNPEYEEILSKGVNGEYILGKKEIMDGRGGNFFKVYLEWIEVSTKK